MNHMFTEEIDFDVPPSTSNEYEVIIHIIFTEPLTFTLKGLDVFQLIKNIHTNRIILIDDFIINPRNIKFIEVHEIEKEEEYVN